MRQRKPVKVCYKQINPNKEPLTPEKLKSFPGLENLTEREAEEIIFSLSALARLLLHVAGEDIHNNDLYQ